MGLLQPSPIQSETKLYDMKMFAYLISDSPRYTPILTWYQVEKRVSWGVIVLLGGGFAIAKASKVT